MRAFFPTLACALLLTAAPASAASLCNCCSSGTSEACVSTCKAVKPAAGMCIAAVDFAGKAKIAPGENPLYGISLKDISLAGASRGDLESFRRLLEKSRKGAERDRAAALRSFRRGKIDSTESAAAVTRYDNALVNYYLGVHAYRDAAK